jgi:thermostable 8-oxoguanine DNA glycosylase
MVDLLNPTNFNRTEVELQEFWLVAICVAGKNGPIQAKKVHQFLEGIPGNAPFDKIRNLIKSKKLKKKLQKVKMGQYRRIEKAFSKSINLNLNTCTLDDLLYIPGVGNKTARFFLLHSRAGCDYVVLDTHVLRFLREECVLQNIPKSTPSGRQYNLLEQQARAAIHRKFPLYSAAVADINIWLKMSGRS